MSKPGMDDRRCRCRLPGCWLVIRSGILLDTDNFQVSPPEFARIGVGAGIGRVFNEGVACK